MQSAVTPEEARLAGFDHEDAQSMNVLERQLAEWDYTATKSAKLAYSQPSIERLQLLRQIKGQIEPGMGFSSLFDRLAKTQGESFRPEAAEQGVKLQAWSSLSSSTKLRDFVMQYLDYLEIEIRKINGKHKMYPKDTVNGTENTSPIDNTTDANMKSLQEIISLLETNKNIIFTGAPGTGKTFLAKKIAKQMIGVKTDKELENSGQFAFIQFHPSYDYTDFVEGLRPTTPEEDGNIGFELKDGIFKEFCKTALVNKTSNFNEIYEQFVDDIVQNPVIFQTPTFKKEFSIEFNSKKSCIAIPNTEKATKMLITKEMIRDYVENDIIRDWKPYTTGIGNYIKQKYTISTGNISDKNKIFIFIIDEINRGEISKIFGELFFSIDPSYRGMKGAVKTQYANMHEDENEVFYVPENVYIIGTMNDIDRSVESFDFAMRRRFTWIEISAERSAENMKLPKEIKDRMAKVNAEISSIEGLHSSYHIGGAYFLDKDGKPRTDFDALWELRLEPLLKEYLRGMPDVEGKLEKLKSAYNAENNGQ